MSSDIKKIVESRDPDQPLFSQAVDEVIEFVSDVVEGDEKYRSGKLLERMIEPERVLMFRVEWKDDNGEIQVNRGYRVQFSSVLGPYKGGLRFHPSVKLDTLKFLAFEQIFKNSLTGLPMGGGKGGSDFDPKGKSDNEVKNFCEAFMKALAPYIGPGVDVPAGDIGVGGREIKYMADYYRKNIEDIPGILSGTPVSEGGINLRTEATGYGLVYFVNEMLVAAGDSFDGKKVIISGSGNVAQYAAEKALELGATVLTVSDSSGYILDEEGIDKDKLEFIKELKNEKRGRVSEYVEKYPGAKFFEGEKPWGVTADVALPCATQNEIDETDADTLISNGVKVVGEGANMPSTTEAVEKFLAAKVLFSPAKASNAGGVGVSGLEIEMHKVNEEWSREEVDEKLKEMMRTIHEACVKYGKGEDGFVNYVKGANIAGFIRVADAMV